jgi:hypothetical protein
MRKEVPDGLSVRTGLGILMRVGASVGGVGSGDDTTSSGRGRGLLGSDRILNGLTDAKDAVVIGKRASDTMGEYIAGTVDIPLGPNGLESVGAYDVAGV